MEIAFFKNPDTITASDVLPKTSAMIIELEVITPEIAQQILSGNTDNRPAKPKHVKFLADQMRAGAWQVTGDPVKISASGRLLDGQHRLMAVVESGTTQNLYVARDCEEEIFSVLDTGRARSAGDVLATAGKKNSNNLAATAKLLYLFEKGTLSTMGQKQKIATHQTLLQYVNSHDLDPSVLQAAMYYGRCRLLNFPEWAVLHYLLEQKEPQRGHAFLSQIMTGLNLTDGHPVYLLRIRLQQARDGRFNFTAVERLALTIKAWNALREGKTIGQLVWRMSEGFPRIV
jgi:hypothetical protein